MKIVLDGDGCPVMSITVDIAKQRGIPAEIVCDFEHRIVSDYAAVIIVDKGADSADFRIVNRISAGDLVITQDYGLAAMGLARGAHILHPNGFVIDTSKIDSLLEQRHIGRELRRKHKSRGPRFKPRTNDDNLRFQAALNKLLDELLS